MKLFHPKASDSKSDNRTEILFSCLAYFTVNFFCFLSHSMIAFYLSAAATNWLSSRLSLPQIRRPQFRLGARPRVENFSKFVVG